MNKLKVIQGNKKQLLEEVKELICKGALGDKEAFSKIRKMDREITSKKPNLSLVKKSDD